MRFLLVMLAVVAMAGVWWFVIWWGRRESDRVVDSVVEAEKRLAEIRTTHGAMIADIKLALELDIEGVPFLAADVRTALRQIVPSFEAGEEG